MNFGAWMIGFKARTVEEIGKNNRIRRSEGNERIGKEL